MLQHSRHGREGTGLSQRMPWGNPSNWYTCCMHAGEPVCETPHPHQMRQGGIGPTARGHPYHRYRAHPRRVKWQCNGPSDSRFRPHGFRSNPEHETNPPIPKFFNRHKLNPFLERNREISGVTSVSKCLTSSPTRPCSATVNSLAASRTSPLLCANPLQDYSNVCTASMGTKNISPLVRVGPERSKLRRIQVLNWRAYHTGMRSRKGQKQAHLGIEWMLSQRSVSMNEQRRYQVGRVTHPLT